MWMVTGWVDLFWQSCQRVACLMGSFPFTGTLECLLLACSHDGLMLTFSCVVGKKRHLENRNKVYDWEAVHVDCAVLKDDKLPLSRCYPPKKRTGLRWNTSPKSDQQRGETAGDGVDVMQVNIMKKLESDAAMNSGGKKVTEYGMLQKGHRKHCSRQKQAHLFCLCPRCSPLHQSSVTLTFFFYFFPLKVNPRQLLLFWTFCSILNLWKPLLESCEHTPWTCH